MLGVVDDLLWSLRRAGLAFATPQALDVARVVARLGFDDRAVLREAIAVVVVGQRRDRAAFDAAFDAFFATDLRLAGDLYDRILARGFDPADVALLRELIEASAYEGAGPSLGGLVGGASELDYLLATAGARRALAPMTHALQTGFFAHKLLDRVGLTRASSVAAALRARLRDALGAERGDALADALDAELDRGRARVRAHVEATLRARSGVDVDRASARRLEEVPFVALTDRELDEVRVAVRRFAERLRGAARVRERHARKGRFDVRRTLRASAATAGVPFRPARRDARRDKPRLVILCDVSDSVRTASRFMLEFVWAVQELFDRTRSFVFVGEVGEVTRLFATEPVHLALARACDGSSVPMADGSSYGRVLAAFERRYADAIDARTTLVILGDGRTNYRPDGAEVIERLRMRARGVVWLCPEPRAQWGVGDSAMARFAARVDDVLDARSAADLERAARTLVARR